jgi:hypothetical protein
MPAFEMVVFETVCPSDQPPTFELETREAKVSELVGNRLLPLIHEAAGDESRKRFVAELAGGVY